jgi:GT2 family glycosyltransferase
MGAALGVRKSVLNQVGGFDQNYFMYFEEVDLCYRIKQAGFKIMYYPQASIIHHGGRSTTQAQMNMNSSWYKSFFYYLRKNKNYPALLIIMTLSLITLGKIIWLAAILLLLFMLYKLL